MSPQTTAVRVNFITVLTFVGLPALVNSPDVSPQLTTGLFAQKFFLAARTKVAKHSSMEFFDVFAEK